MTLGDRLRRAREKRGWSQLYVSQVTKISNTVLSNYERNYRDPDSDTLKKLADLYDVSLDYLLGRTNDLKSHVTNDQTKNDAETTIRLIEEEAKKMGLSPTDPLFKKMLTDAFKLLRLARGKDSE